MTRPMKVHIYVNDQYHTNEMESTKQSQKHPVYEQQEKGGAEKTKDNPVGWLVGCFKDLRRFSDLSAISRLGNRR